MLGTTHMDASGAGSAANPLGKPASRARETLQFQPALVKRAYADSPREPTAPPSPQNKTISRRLSLSLACGRRIRPPAVRAQSAAAVHLRADTALLKRTTMFYSRYPAAAPPQACTRPGPFQHPSLPTHYISGQLTCNSRADRAPRIGSGISSLIS